MLTEAAPARRTSPTRAASTGASGSSQRHGHCGCSASRCATWERDRRAVDLPTLLAAAAAASRRPGRRSSTSNDPRFLPPGDMPARIAALVRASTTVPAPRDRGRAGAQHPGEPRRGVRRRRASRPRDAVRPRRRRRARRRRRRAERAAVPADRRPLGLPVLAGPVEATALGNVLVQARALGALSGDLEALRRAGRRAPTTASSRHEPHRRGVVTMKRQMPKAARPAPAAASSGSPS